MDITNYINLPASMRLPTILRRLPVLLLLGDIVGLLACLAIAVWLRLGKVLYSFDPTVWVFVLLVVTVLYLADAYHPESQIAGLRAPYRILLGMLAVAMLTSALIYLSGAFGSYELVGRGIFLPSLGIFTIWAVMLRLLVMEWFRDRIQQSRWLVLGTGDGAIKFVQKFQKFNPLGKFVLLADTDENTSFLREMRLDCLGSISNLPRFSQEPWSAVIVATDIKFSDRELEQLMQLRLRGIPIYRLPDFYETLWYKLPSFLLQDKWLAFSAGFQLMPGRFKMRMKRLADLIIAGSLIIIMSPLMLLTAIAVKLDSRGPVFYSQIRTGLHGKAFRVYKFRSMYQNAEAQGAKWADKRDSRITRVGRWLRLTRIDELPQVWNVLRGDMSLIGPRPERPEFDIQLKQEIPYYELRYLVKPGITGWAQVLYPYGASVEDAYEKLAYDLYYIKNYSIWLDLAIVFKTIRVVLLGKGR
jgi:exopolysaccharide biosynthesis polyprenyl glycosylphosphotransferase